MSKKGKIDSRIFLRLLKFAKPYRRLLISALIFTIVLACLSTIRPMLISGSVQKFIIKTQNPNLFLSAMALILGLLLMETILQFFTTYFSNLLAQNIIRDIRIRVFNHILEFRVNYFDKTPVGSLVTRVVSDIEAISEVFSSGLIDLIGDFLMLIGVLTFMFVLDWKLTLCTLAPVPVLIFATRIFAKAMRKSFQQESSAVNKLNTFVQERLTGMNIVQLFGRQKQEKAAFEEVNKIHRTAHINAVWAFSIFFPIVEILSSFSIALILVYAGMTFTGSKEDADDHFSKILAFVFYVQMMYRPIRQLADKFNILQRGIVRSERVFEIIDTDENVQDSGSITGINFGVPIVFKDVHFAYNEENWVLKGIDLTIKPGELIAFVGATGAGKTSIVNLLSRFYEYQKGSIYIGETELKDIELNYLRKNIAIVLQDVFLFSDTLHNNITLGNPDITREQVISAAKNVGAHEFIEKLPGSYDYQIQERGGVLSVGQRQILAFIRAYVYNPHILILDEATSSVDSESEQMIQRATEELTKGRTSIVIAHRLSTIQSADKIVVLEKGKIVESGNHAELLQQKGYYKRLHDLQYKHH